MPRPSSSISSNAFRDSSSFEVFRARAKRERPAMRALRGLLTTSLGISSASRATARSVGGSGCGESSAQGASEVCASSSGRPGELLVGVASAVLPQSSLTGIAGAGVAMLPGELGPAALPLRRRTADEESDDCELELSSSLTTGAPRQPLPPRSSLLPRGGDRASSSTLETIWLALFWLWAWPGLPGCEGGEE